MSSFCVVRSFLADHAQSGPDAPLVRSRPIWAVGRTCGSSRGRPDGDVAEGVGANRVPAILATLAG